jgi:hypothetical protein
MQRVNEIPYRRGQIAAVAEAAKGVTLLVEREQSKGFIPPPVSACVHRRYAAAFNFRYSLPI